MTGLVQIAPMQQTSSAGTTITFTLPTATVAGDFLLVNMVGLNQALTLSDNKGGGSSTWVDTRPGTNSRTQQWYVENCAAGITQLTVSWSTPGFCIGVLQERDDVETSSSLIGSAFLEEAAVTTWATTAVACGSQAAIGFSVAGTYSGTTVFNGCPLGFTPLSGFSDPSGRNFGGLCSNNIDGDDSVHSSVRMPAGGTQGASSTTNTSATVFGAISFFKLRLGTVSTGKAFRYKGVKTTSASSCNGLGKYSNRLNTSSPFTPKQGKNVPPIFVEQFFDTSSGGTTYTFTVSGGIVFSGGITRMTKTKVQIPSGGLIFSGGITRMTKTKVQESSGGIVFSGSPTIGHIKTYQPSGNITFSGTILPQHIKTYQPTGGIVFGGTVEQIHIKIVSPSGSIVFSGTAPITFTGSTTYTITPSGGITFAGTAPTQKDKIYIPSGNITFSGTNENLKVKILLPTGNITFTGTAAITFLPAGGGAIITTRLPLTGAGST